MKKKNGNKMGMLLIGIFVVLVLSAIAGWYGKAHAQDPEETYTETDEGPVIIYCEYDTDGTKYCWQ